MRRNAKEVYALLDQLLSGDMSTAAFCEQHQINKYTFRNSAHAQREFDRALENI